MANTIIKRLGDIQVFKKYCNLSFGRETCARVGTEDVDL